VKRQDQNNRIGAGDPADAVRFAATTAALRLNFEEKET
jgi:hypothetical protein